MNEDRIEMSQGARDRLKVLSLVVEGKRSQLEAARLLGLSTRQVRRLERRLAQEGDKGIVHRLRGRPSNRRRPQDLRKQAVEIFRREMPDFGALLASEKLAERGLVVPAGTLRDWLRTEGLLQPRRKRDKHRQRRERRECFGELVQSDGSHHDWLEGRGPRMVLVVMIDDATSKTMARFYPAETTEAYMDLLKRYLRKRGRMTAMYVDRDSIFRAEKKDSDYVQPTLTQFKRALNDLHIGLILANSPQAKGRVERFNKTAQDRLVKELRLVPRSTKKFERLYRRRTSVERVNARLKLFWGMDDGNIRGPERFHARVGVVMAVHAAFAVLLAKAPRHEGTLSQTRLSPIALALQ